VHKGTLANWVHRYRDEHPVEEKPLSQPERARLAAHKKRKKAERKAGETLF